MRDNIETLMLAAVVILIVSLSAVFFVASFQDYKRTTEPEKISTIEQTDVYRFRDKGGWRYIQIPKKGD